MSYDKKESGKRIRTLREEKGLTIEKLAEEINYSREHIGKIESGKTQLSMNALLRFANYFNVTADYLIEGNGVKNDNIKKDLEQAIALLNSIIRKL